LPFARQHISAGAFIACVTEHQLDRFGAGAACSNQRETGGQAQAHKRRRAARRTDHRLSAHKKRANWQAGRWTVRAPDQRALRKQATYSRGGDCGVVTRSRQTRGARQAHLAALWRADDDIFHLFVLIRASNRFPRISRTRRALHIRRSRAVPLRGTVRVWRECCDAARCVFSARAHAANSWRRCGCCSRSADELWARITRLRFTNAFAYGRHRGQRMDVSSAAHFACCNINVASSLRINGRVAH